MNNYEMLRAKYSEQKAGDAATVTESSDATFQETRNGESEDLMGQSQPLSEAIENQNTLVSPSEQQQIRSIETTCADSAHEVEPIQESIEAAEETEISDQRNDCAKEKIQQDEADESTVILGELKQNKAMLDNVLQVLESQETELQAIRQAIGFSSSAVEQIKVLAGNVEEFKQNAIRHEKANIDILRDSKNFQASIRDQMQRELDGYHKLHSSTAYAPILTEVANLYITTKNAISYVSDEKIRDHFTELILESISELLSDQGVEIHSTDVGQARSLRTCKTRKTIPTGDKSLHGLVAASNHPSFVLGNLVLIKESVDTYVYNEALDLPGGDDTTATSISTESVE